MVTLTISKKTGETLKVEQFNSITDCQDWINGEKLDHQLIVSIQEKTPQEIESAKREEQERAQAKESIKTLKGKQTLSTKEKDDLLLLLVKAVG